MVDTKRMIILINNARTYLNELEREVESIESTQANQSKRMLKLINDIDGVYDDGTRSCFTCIDGFEGEAKCSFNGVCINRKEWRERA